MHLFSVYDIISLSLSVLFCTVYDDVQLSMHRLNQTCKTSMVREVNTFKLQLGGPLVLFVAVLTVLLLNLCSPTLV